MKIAKASEADLEMAMELCGAIESLIGHWPTLPAGLCTSDDAADRFDCDDDSQCRTVLRHLLAIAERASLMRVVWGCAVMLDPRNKLVDPASDTIERHPDVAAVEAAQEDKALRAALAELVALHDICATLPAWPMSPDPDKDKRADFDRRHPLAWVAARRVLGMAP